MGTKWVRNSKNFLSRTDGSEPRPAPMKLPTIGVIARDTATADEPAAITLALRRHPVEKLAIFRLQSSNAEFSAPIPAQLSIPVTLKDFRRFVESWKILEYLGRISKKSASSHRRF